MALTPEDVVNKRFQATKFREGYDQDEVDDFLDEVVVELRRLNQENEELRQRLVGGRSPRIDERARRAPPLQPAPAAVYAEPAAPPPTRRPVPHAGRPPAAQSDARRTPWTRATPTTCCSSPAASTRSTCARASRSATRSSPRATPPRPASSPRPRRSSARRSAPRPGARRPRARVDELRVFERDYRLKLKSYIEGQLRELDHERLTAGRSSGRRHGRTAAAPSPSRAPSGTAVERVRVPAADLTRALAAERAAKVGTRHGTPRPCAGRRRPVAVACTASTSSSKFLVVTNLTEGEVVPVLGDVLQWQFVTQPRRGLLARERHDLDLHDPRGGRDHVHRLVRPPHPLDRLGARVRARCSAACSATSPTGSSASRASALGHVIDFISTPGAIPAIYNVADIAIVSSMVLFMILTIRGVGLDGTASPSARMPRPTRSAADRRRPAGATDGPGAAADDGARRSRARRVRRVLSMEHRSFPVPDGLDGERVDAASRSCSASRAPSRPRSPRPGESMLDGASVGKSDRLRAGGWLEVSWQPPRAPRGRADRRCPSSASCTTTTTSSWSTSRSGVAAHPSSGWDGPTVVGALAAAGFRISTSGAAERAGRRAPPRRRHERPHGRREVRARLHRAQARSSTTARSRRSTTPSCRAIPTRSPARSTRRSGGIRARSGSSRWSPTASTR